MSEKSKAYTDFASKSFSWNFIERPALDRAIPYDVYTRQAAILDIGCGPGRVVDYHIRRGATEANITGIDPNPEHISTSMGRFPNAHFITQGAQDARLQAASFDVVTAQLSLRYLQNGELATLFGKVAGALRPRGLFFMLDSHPVRDGLRDGLDHYFDEGQREVATPWGGSETYHYRTMSTYINTLVESGLVVAGLDECPIAQEGRAEIYASDLAYYNGAPARFAILATKSQ
ncbi:MAG TPA: class I SAM-dependent methyltransferase [Candidatus Saccharimonadales bacterium]|nr:class I SAM-dependent methyltransferase [Candidatus Saccharimonadales bacterium]